MAEAIDNVAPTLTDDVGKVVASDAHVDGDVASSNNEPMPLGATL